MAKNKTDAQTSNEEQRAPGLVGALQGDKGVGPGQDSEGGVDSFMGADALDQDWGESTDHTAVAERSGKYAQDRLGPRNSEASRITGYKSSGS